MSGITHNIAASRYEQIVDGHTVFADVRLQGDILYITHVEAPLPLRGKGAAGNFMQGMMETLRAQNVKKVVPVCGYAAAWLSRHSEYADML